MGREEHRAPRAGEVDDHVLHDLAVDRIETAERLVEEDQLGVVEQGAGELDLLLHALGEVLDLVIGPVVEPEPLEPRVGPLSGGFRRRPLISARKTRWSTTFIFL